MIFTKWQWQTFSICLYLFFWHSRTNLCVNWFICWIYLNNKIKWTAWVRCAWVGFSSAFKSVGKWKNNYFYVQAFQNVPINESFLSTSSINGYVYVYWCMYIVYILSGNYRVTPFTRSLHHSPSASVRIKWSDIANVHLKFLCIKEHITTYIMYSIDMCFGKLFQI